MYGFEKLTFERNTPSWRAVEQRLLALGIGRVRLREAGASDDGLAKAKALVDIDHPHSRLATLLFSDDVIEVHSTWLMIDSIVDELVGLGGNRVPARRLARKVAGTIDYFSVYDNGDGGWRLTTEMKGGEVFLIWKGFASSSAAAMAAASAELARAWDVACDEDATRAERRDAAQAVARWSGIESAVRPASIKPGTYGHHEQACAADLGVWLENAGHDGGGFDVEEL